MRKHREKLVLATIALGERGGPFRHPRLEIFVGPLERFPDARAALPVHDALAHGIEGGVGVAGPDQSCDPGQARSEHEHFQGRARSPEGVGEAQQETAVTLHRSRNVTYQNDGAWSGTALPETPRQRLTAGAE